MVDMVDYPLNPINIQLYTPTPCEYWLYPQTSGIFSQSPKLLISLGVAWPAFVAWQQAITEKEEVTKNFYSQPAFMYEVGDREEGGSFLVNGVEVHPPGQGVGVIRNDVGIQFYQANVHSKFDVIWIKSGTMNFQCNIM